jgi:hypothetical protein
MASTKPSVVREDLEAQGTDRSRRETVTSLLSRANVHRLRTEWEAAEELCLQALRVDPEDPDPYLILGDIHLAQNKLEAAQRWFELFVELQPENSSGREKLQVVRNRMMVEAENTAALRLQSKQADSSVGWVRATGIALFLAVVGLVAYSAFNPKSAKRSVVSVAVSAPAKPKAAPPVVQTKVEPQPPLYDRTLRSRIGEATALGEKVLSVSLDPRTSTLTTTVVMEFANTGRQLVGSIARAVFLADPDVESVVVRAVQDDRVVYVGELSRERYSSALRSGTDVRNIDLTSLITGEWTPGTPRASTQRAQ